MIKCPLFVLLLNLSLLIAPSGDAVAGKSDTVRKPVHAGKYYPADKKALQEAVKLSILKTTSSNAGLLGEMGELKAVIMPHGNIKETKRTNGSAAKILMGKQYDKVILLSPDHYLVHNSNVISSYGLWETPLGNSKVHADTTELMRRWPRLFRRIGFSENVDHAIESVLPFLQYSLNDFTILPILTGRCDVEKTSDAIVQLNSFYQPDSPYLHETKLFVAITTLSEKLNYQQAVIWDKGTLDLILKLDTVALARRQNSACGIQSVLILLNIAKRYKWRPYLLEYTAGAAGETKNKKNAVGYAAVGFYGGPMKKTDTGTGVKQLNESQGRLLLKIARRTIAKKLGYKTSDVTIPDEPVLHSARGTFVTLKIDNQLRGCIGNLSSEISLAEGVAGNAENAAFHDSRFPPLEKDELDRTEIEVSILTEPVPLEYRNADDLIVKLKTGIDGVILRKGSAGSTFLPQVWEQLPDPVAFLEHLCMKAGLPKDEWRTGELEILTYQVQYFEEKKQ